MAFDFSALNSAVVSRFGPACTYFPANATLPVPTSFPINLISVDPIRKEGVSGQNFIIKFGQKADFDSIGPCGYVPSKGDKVITETGFPYAVEDVQMDAADGYSLTLKKTR